MGFHLGGHAPLPAAVNLQEGAFTRSAILRAGWRVLQQQYALRSVVRGHSLLNPPCVASLEIPRGVFVSYYFYLIKSAKRGRAHRAVVRLRLEIISGRWRLLLLGDVEDHLQPDVHVHDEMAVEVPHAGVVSDEAQNSVENSELMEHTPRTRGSVGAPPLGEGAGLIQRVDDGARIIIQRVVDCRAILPH